MSSSKKKLSFLKVISVIKFINHQLCSISILTVLLQHFSTLRATLLVPMCLHAQSLPLACHSSPLAGLCLIWI